jgi:hypothetical protein
MGYLLLSNLAWLKRPASASRLKVHELVALCSAALRPSRKTWDAFLRHLNALEQSGAITSDEAAAIIATGLTDRILVEEGVDEDTDASTIADVVERVKDTYRTAAAAQVRTAQQSATKSEAEALRLRMALDRRARGIAKVTTWVLAAILAGSLVAGAALSIADTAGGARPGPAALGLAIIPLAIAGVMSLFWGFHIRGWRRGLEDRVADEVRRWLGGPAQGSLP